MVLISNALPDLGMLSKAASEHAHVVIFDGAKDNLDTINVRLHDMVESSGHKIDHLAVLDHAKAGQWKIGSDKFDLFSLPSRRSSFEDLGSTLSDAGQIQLYGCSLAGDPMGQALVDRMALFTHADVFASLHKIGGIAHGEGSRPFAESASSLTQSQSPAEAPVSTTASVHGTAADTAPQHSLATPKASHSALSVSQSVDSNGIPFMFQPLQPDDPPVIITDADSMRVEGFGAQTIPEIAVYDPGSRFVDVVLSTNHGGLSVPNPLTHPGVEVRGNNGRNEPVLRLSGFFNDLNDTLKQVTYKPINGYTGPDDLGIYLHSRSNHSLSEMFVPSVEKTLPIEVVPKD